MVKQCPLCLQVVANENEAAFHVWLYHLNFKPKLYKEKIHYCKVCEEYFNHYEMIEHLQTCHPTYAWCQFCGQVFVQFKTYETVHLTRGCPTRQEYSFENWIDIVHHIECHRRHLLDYSQTVWTPSQHDALEK